MDNTVKKTLNVNFLVEDAQKFLKGKFGIYTEDKNKKLNFEPCKENSLKDALNNGANIFISDEGKAYSVKHLISKEKITLQLTKLK